MVRRWQLIAVAFTISACELVEPVPPGQEYLFDVSYVNFAWGLKWVGLVVDVNGDVIAYDRDEAWGPAGSSAFTQAELDDRYARNRRVVGQVSRTELARRLNHLSAVGTDYSSPNVACADAGTVSYLGFEYDVQTERYTPVVVREEGDRARQNTSQAGRELAEWLIEIALNADITELTGFQTGEVCVP